MRYLFNILFACLCLFLLSSCNTSKKILYFQDIPINQSISIDNASDIVIAPKDLISIVVSSKDAQLATLFNLPRVSFLTANPQLTEDLNRQTLGYVVDMNGNIDFPVLGSLKVGGLSRIQLSAMIKERLLTDNQIKDPVVTVDFLNLKVSVLGEVKNPGKYGIDRDQITILEAISMAGDLTIHGKRDGVFVIREKEGHRTTFKIDLRSSDLFSSQAYYLQQNDVVYIEPNSARAGQSTINENSLKSVSLWMSVSSLVVTLAVLIFK